MTSTDKPAILPFVRDIGSGKRRCRSWWSVDHLRTTDADVNHFIGEYLAKRFLEQDEITIFHVLHDMPAKKGAIEIGFLGEIQRSAVRGRR